MKWIIALLALIGLILFPILHHRNYVENSRPALIAEATAAAIEAGFPIEIREKEGMDVSLHGVVATFEQRQEAQDLIDATHGLITRDGDNFLKVPGKFKAAFDEATGAVILEGQLTAETAQNLTGAFAADSGVEINADGLEQSAIIDDPPGLRGKNFSQLLQAVFASASSRSISVEGNHLAIEAPATREIAAEWQKLAGEGFGSIDADFEIFPSEYHLPGYRVTSQVPAEKLQLVTRALDENNVFFDSGSAEIRPDQVSALDAAAKAIEDAGPKAQFVLGGHADATGSAELNQKLSRERSETVKSELTSRGIKAGSLEVVSFGATELVGDNDTEEGRARSRRVEIRVK
ncbi:MAG: OmpA family protein [Verrucomicrobiota bacterium]